MTEDEKLELGIQDAKKSVEALIADIDTAKSETHYQIYSTLVFAADLLDEANQTIAILLDQRGVR